jgi:hypothetical protein
MARLLDPRATPKFASSEFVARRRSNDEARVTTAARPGEWRVKRVTRHAENCGMPPFTANVTYPYWTIETVPSRGLWRRSPKQLLVPQTRPECVGGWLTEYLQQHPSDHTFARLRVLEHPMDGIAPLVVDRPRGFIDYARDPLAGLTYLPDLQREELAASR